MKVTLYALCLSIARRHKFISFSLSRAIVRLTLLLKFRSRITTSPAVPAVDRKKAQAVPLDVIPPADGKSVAYKGPRTGKIIRTLHGGVYKY